MSNLYRIPLTGTTPERAAGSVQHLLDAITAEGEAGFPSVVEAAWRAARGKSRWIVTGRTPGEVTTALAEFALDGACAASGQHRGNDRRVTFVFSGMGPQWAGMGRSLADNLPGFAEHIKRIDKELTEHYGQSVWGHLAEQPEGGQLPTALAQPGNFLIQAALHDLLIADGVIPEAVIGHSAGEVASAYAAGVYTMPEAARVAVVRGRLQAQLAGRGAMVAMGLSEDEAMEVLADFDRVSLAAVNDHQAVTVAGDEDQIAQIAERMREEQIFAKVLRVEVPYHSPVMDEIASDLTEQMSFIEPKQARIPLYSTLTGALSNGDEWGATYWPKNVREPVRFAKAVDAALADGSKCFIELAPHPVLSKSIEALAPRDEGITATPLLSRRDDEYEFFVAAAGKLAVEGVGRPPRTRSATLPPAFREPQAHWDQDTWYEEDRVNAFAAADVPLLGKRVPDHTDEFEVEVSLSDQPWIEGHQAQGLGPVVPATMWAELLGLAATGGEERSISLTNLTIVQGLPVLSNPTLLRMRVSGGVVRCVSRPIGETASWALNAIASIGSAPTASDAVAPDFAFPEGTVLDSAALYALFRLKGLSYSGAFENLANVTLPTEASQQNVAWATIASQGPFAAGHHAPWILDAGLQLLIAAARDLGQAMYLPFRLGRVDLLHPMSDGENYHARAEVLTRSDDELVGSIRFYNTSGVLVAEMADVVCLRNNSDDAARSTFLNRNTYALHSVTPLEILDRFTPAHDDEDFEEDGAPVVETAVEAEVEAGSDVDPAVEAPQEYWLTSVEGDVLPAGDSRRVLDISSDTSAIPTGTNAHLLWVVPNESRTEDAIATFELVNRIGALGDLGLTLTLIGSVDQQWLFGLRRSANNSFTHPVRVILAADGTPAEDLDLWISVLPEREIILDGDTRLNRVEPMTTDDLLTVDKELWPADSTVAYDLPSLGRMAVTVEPVPKPGPGDITIDNLAVPLTWKDVGKVMGTIGGATVSTFAGNNLSLGAVGHVVAAGPGVPFAVGDLVCGAVRRPFRQQITINVKDEFVHPLSEAGDPVVKLTLMMPWVTTLAALDDIGRIRAGDSVFIQSGAGALGSVLVHHALSVGCRVVTSAGTLDKAEALQAKLGANVDVIVARGEEIPGALLAAGHGNFDCITAVVNGAARASLFALLRGRGRYIDLGKPSGPDEVQLAMAVDGNRSLTRVDTDQIGATDPEWFEDLIVRSLAKVEDPANQTPVTRYPIDQLPKAIRELASGVTTGSLAVDLKPDTSVTQARRVSAQLDADGIYLITGGYGAVGLMCAQWMASNGARTIVLTGRSGKASASGQASIDLIECTGADVRVVAADGGDAAAMAELIGNLAKEAPIRGVVHAAGVIADGPFDEIDADRVRRSFGAKVDGAHNLVDALKRLEGGLEQLDFFLMTSSMSGAFGVSIQGTYAAANAALDGLAVELRDQGVHATAMQLGPIAEGGMAADDRNERFFAASGMSMVAPRDLFGIFDLAASGVAPVFFTCEVEWARVGRAEPGNSSSSVLGHIVAEATAGSDQAELEQLMELSIEDRSEVLTMIMVGLFAEALGLDTDAVTADGSFADMGIDSLAVVEIQVGINDVLQMEVPLARLFLPDGNIAHLAGRIAEYLEENVDETVIDLTDNAQSAGVPS